MPGAPCLTPVNSNRWVFRPSRCLNLMPFRRCCPCENPRFFGSGTIGAPCFSLLIRFGRQKFRTISPLHRKSKGPSPSSSKGLPKSHWTALGCRSSFLRSSVRFSTRVSIHYHYDSLVHTLRHGGRCAETVSGVVHTGAADHRRGLHGPGDSQSGGGQKPASHRRISRTDPRPEGSL